MKLKIYPLHEVQHDYGEKRTIASYYFPTEEARLKKAAEIARDKAVKCLKQDAEDLNPTDQQSAEKVIEYFDKGDFADAVKAYTCHVGDWVALRFADPGEMETKVPVYNVLVTYDRDCTAEPSVISTGSPEEQLEEAVKFALEYVVAAYEADGEVPEDQPDYVSMVLAKGHPSTLGSVIDIFNKNHGRDIQLLDPVYI